MTISDLLFLAALLASAVTLIGAAVTALRGRRAAAAKSLLIFAACAAVYVTISVGAAYVRPQRIRAAHDPWCFDDWCLEVSGVSSVPSPPNVRYTVGLRIFSTARRVSQRANGAWIYLIDERQRLYAPTADPSAVPLTVELRPLESVDTVRVFEVSPDARTLGLVTGHPGHYCGLMSILFIGQATCLFGRPDLIAIK
jgi:hypothetical protein